jgi:hypothetical protein
VTGDAQPQPPAYQPPDGLVPDQRQLRLSHDERDRVVQFLNTAFSEGRLTVPEFEERVEGVLQARTYGEIEPFLADLPVATAAPPPPPRDVLELRSTASTIKRRGRWSVPRRLVIRSKAGSVKLDFAEAMISYPVVEIDLDVLAGSTELVLPDGATADIDDVEMFAGNAKSKVPSAYDAPGAPVHFQVHGSSKAGSLKVRYRRHFWRWSW